VAFISKMMNLPDVQINDDGIISEAFENIRRIPGNRRSEKSNPFEGKL
jgi:hypothetical protein